MVRYTRITEHFTRREGNVSSVPAIIYRENEYRFYKKQHFKDFGMCRVYYCSKYRTVKCKVKIREVIGSAYFYISEIEHSCKYPRLNDQHNKSQLQRKPQPKLSDRRTAKKRKYASLEPTGFTGIRAVLPSRGPLCGNQSVDIFFNVSSQNYFRSLMNGSITCLNYCSFGEKSATFHSRVNVMDDYYEKKLKACGMKENNERLYDECVSSSFVLMAMTPPSENPMTVDVTIGLRCEMNSMTLRLEDGYTYEHNDEKKKTNDNNFALVDDDHDDESIGFEPNDDLGTLSDFPMFDNSISFDSLTDTDLAFYDIFGRSMLHYAVAQDKIELVKYLIDKRNMDPTKNDVCGFRPLEVASHFNRKELVSFLSTCHPQKNVDDEDQKKKKLVEKKTSEQKNIRRKSVPLLAADFKNAYESCQTIGGYMDDHSLPFNFEDALTSREEKKKKKRQQQQIKLKPIPYTKSKIGMVSDLHLMETTFDFMIGIGKYVKIPSFRLCPYCESLCFKNDTNCKHTKCMNCDSWFCHICLSSPKKKIVGGDVSPPDEEWMCGDSFKLCPTRGKYQDQNGIFRVQSRLGKHVWKVV